MEEEKNELSVVNREGEEWSAGVERWWWVVVNAGWWQVGGGGGWRVMYSGVER